MADPKIDIVQDCANFETWADDDCFLPLSRFPDYVPEKDNPDVLIRGRWLERGGSGFLVSSAGTGKSIWLIQALFAWTHGKSFCGLTPNRPLKAWVFQSEDSATRVTIDREDIIAELSEQTPDVDWRETAENIKFFRTTGENSIRFLEWLESMLERARKAHALPSILAFNPFFAFIGGEVNNSAVVTPFLRGGTINGEYTKGLQHLLEVYRVGALFAHHTPKPPMTDKELAAWMQSQYPEYQGAGSSEITNWGRSFITMMKVKDQPDKVCLTAGKNGAGLDWPLVAGARRMYLAWSNGRSIDSTEDNPQRRHAWRELTKEELEEVCKEAAEGVRKDEDKIVAKLLEKPLMYAQCKPSEFGLSQSRFRVAWKAVKDNLEEFGLYSAPWYVSKTEHGSFIGQRDAAIREAEIEAKNRMGTSC